MVAIENGYPIGMDISRVKEFADDGTIYISITHNGHNQLSDSNTGEEDSVWLHNGLSEFGIEVIKEMNKWGIMIDCSHPSRKAMLDMIKYSEAPIIASHSGARALCDHSRNLDDEQLKLLKENGGVIQVVGLGYYLNKDKSTVRRDSINRIRSEVAAKMGFELLPWSEVRRLSDEDMEVYRKNYYAMHDSSKPIVEKRLADVPDVNVKDFVDHIDHIVKTIGIDHVGIGTDFGGGGGIEGFSDHSEALNVTLELVRRGYSEEDIKKIWGENLLRVLDQVQKIAAEKQKAG
jgi:microsomal dipeptidase-like Zn-dependent dipeptidase